MKLEPPLSNLVARCQTVCVPECCGIDAYDFSPIHIASYLLMWKSGVDEREVGRLRAQLGALKENYGSSGASADGVTIEEMNQGFTGEAVDGLVDEVASNLDVALGLIEKSEAMRKGRPIKPLEATHVPAAPVRQVTPRSGGQRGAPQR